MQSYKNSTCQISAGVIVVELVERLRRKERAAVRLLHDVEGAVREQEGVGQTRAPPRPRRG